MTMLTNESMATGPWLDPRSDLWPQLPFVLTGGSDELAEMLWLMELNNGEYIVAVILYNGMLLDVTFRNMPAHLKRDVKRFALINRT